MSTPKKRATFGSLMSNLPQKETQEEDTKLNLIDTEEDHMKTEGEGSYLQTKERDPQKKTPC